MYVYNEEISERYTSNMWFEIEGQPMWLSRWTPHFTSEEDSPLTTVWVLLPKLPFHLHTWYFVKQIMRAVRVPMEIDVATKRRTRPSMAKLRVEIDLTKPKLSNVFVGQRNSTNPLQGFEQKIEYEGVPKYCSYYRSQGHSANQCRRRERDNEEATEGTRIRQGKLIFRQMLLGNRKLQNKSNRDWTTGSSQG